MRIDAHGAAAHVHSFHSITFIFSCLFSSSGPQGRPSGGLRAASGQGARSQRAAEYLFHSHVSQKTNPVVYSRGSSFYASGLLGQRDSNTKLVRIHLSSFDCCIFVAGTLGFGFGNFEVYEIEMSVPFVNPFGMGQHAHGGIGLPTLPPLAPMPRTLAPALPPMGASVP